MVIDVGVSTNDTNKHKNEPLNLVYLNNFNDSYHDDSKKDYEMDELEKKARRIKRRYRNVSQYNEAVIVYCEYMARLSHKYGRREFFNFLLQSGGITEFLPAFPRLKSNRMNREKLKKGIFENISKVELIDPEQAQAWVEMMSEGIEIEEDELVPLKAVKVKTASSYDKFAEDEDIESTSSYGSTNRRKTEIDYLEEYFRAKNIMKNKKKKEEEKKEDDDKITGHEWFYNQYSFEDDDMNETRWYEGSLMTGEEIENAKTMRMMKENGWNPLKIMRSSPTSRYGSSHYGETSAIRHMKNMDKKEKKAKKQKKKNDDFLTRVLTDNKFMDFEDFESAMQDFTFDGISWEDEEE